MDDYSHDMEKMGKDIHEQVSESFGYLDTVMDDFGATVWDKYWTQPKEAEDRIEDLF